MENRGTSTMQLYYQVNYTLCDVPEGAAYFHAYFNRTNPTPYKENYVILNEIKGRGHYVGTYMANEVHNRGWWGEGEIKFFMDDDDEFPTICGTGTDDYFCGSQGFVNCDNTSYQAFCTPYAGVPQIIRPDGEFNAMTCFGMYRWHVVDPIRFKKRLKVTIQDLGLRSGDRYLAQRSDISSIAFYYLEVPTALPNELPDRDALEIIQR